MLFNTLPFLIFAPIFFLVYFQLHGRVRLVWILIASYFFYGWWDWRFTGLLLGATGLGYFCGCRIADSETQRDRLGWLWVTIAIHISVLGYFKYTNFAAGSISTLLRGLGLDVPTPHWNIILPVGISFYTFTTLSYTIDIYHGKIRKDQMDLLRFATYTCLFPHLVAGPVLRARLFLPQLESDQRVDWERIGIGVTWIIWGFFLKICVADNAASFVNTRFDRPELFNSQALVLAVILFAFQIYADFSGYSLIAIGLAKMMGFDFGINFNRPYFAVNFSDFWQRWHISLSTWIREYIYIPLGGNKGGTPRTLFNLTATMFLAGLWHGAGWTFAIWGLLHGLYLVLQRVVSKPFAQACGWLRLPVSAQSVIAMATVFTLTCVGWVFFRAKGLDQAMEILTACVSWRTREHLTFGGGKYQLVRTVLAIAVVLLVDLAGEAGGLRQWYAARSRCQLVGSAAVVVLILFLGSFTANSFIYFQF